MGVLQLSAVGLVLLLGLVGVLLPGVPGLLLCWAAVMWWSVSLHSGPAWPLLFGASAVVLPAQVLHAALPGDRVGHEHRAGWRVRLGAGAGGLLGFCLLPVAGALPGMWGGVYLVELGRLRDAGNARASARAAMRSLGTATLVNYPAALLVTAAWVLTVLLADG